MRELATENHRSEQLAPMSVSGHGRFVFRMHTSLSVEVRDLVFL